MRHKGSCHCGTVQFEVEAAGTPEVHVCNCSMCRNMNYHHLIVSRDQFTLLQGRENLQNYRFNTGVAQHLFCQTCGVKSFYVPRSNPEGVSVNLFCLDPVPNYTAIPFDGQNWEQHAKDLAHLT